jgi:site-specific DNA-methyltransferase (adenine-specific)
LFTYVGGVVLDPFVGSGTTLIAARLLKRRAVGIDISRGYCEVAKERLIKEVKANMPSLV